MLSILDPPVIETGYFADISGYRKIYGDCQRNDILASPATLSECSQMCDDDTKCKAFTLVNASVLRLFRRYWQKSNICYLKYYCKEEMINRSHGGLYTYVKGLTKIGKAIMFTSRMVQIMKFIFKNLQMISSYLLVMNTHNLSICHRKAVSRKVSLWFL